MLRAKQIGTLSNGARSFFLSGSRCNNAADGTSCTCTEDEACLSRRQNQTQTQTHRRGLVSQNPHNFPARAGVGAFISGDLAGSKENIARAGPVKQVVLPPSCLGDNSAEMAHSFPVISDQFVRAGVAAVTFLSDVVSYGNSKDGLGIFHSTKSCMVDPNRISSIRQSHVTQVNREGMSVSELRQSPEEKVLTRGGSVSKSNSVRGSNNNGPHPRNVNSSQAQNAPQRTRSKSDFSPSAPSQPSNVVIRPPRDMKFQSGYDPSRKQYANNNRSIVDRVSQILHELKWGRAAEAALKSLNYSMDAYQANQVLKQLQDQNVALGFFYWLKRQTGFRHDGHTYTTMVGILGRAKQFQSINRLIHEMRNEGCRPNVVTYNRLIHSYGRANYLKEAIGVFDQMRTEGCNPDRVTYCTLIDIHSKAGFLDVALSLYDDMQKAGLSPDTFTYSVMINCLGKAGHLSSAHNLFCKMVDEGCVPNLVTYNIMLALQAKARNYGTALELYRQMRDSGFEPDKVTYSIVMEVLGHCGCLEEAESVFVEMRRKNWVPDEPVYGLLVDLWGKTGNIEKAREWYQAMLEAGLQPNVPTCNSLLSAFLRVHRLSEAYDLLQSMVGLGLNPSLQTYTLLLSCCTEAQTPYDMGFCCELMAITNHPAHAFLISMPSAGPDGQNVRDHMARFLDLMHSEDREGKRGLVDAVVDFLHKSGLKEEAGSVWEVAAERNVYPEAVKERGPAAASHWLINLHVMSDGTAVTALSRTLAWFRSELLVSGICPERIDIVTGWGRRSKVTGTSLVRQAVQELLRMFNFPFFTENGNTGCFVGCGEPLNRWLLQSCVERMHLL